MILRAPHAEFEIKSGALSEQWYQPGCLQLRFGSAVDIGGGAAIVVYGDPGESIHDLYDALAEELCRIWCRDVWAWTDSAGALDQEGGIHTSEQVNEICMALRGLRKVKATGTGMLEAKHEFRDPLVPHRKPIDEQDATDLKHGTSGYNDSGIFEHREPEKWGPQYQPLDVDDAEWVGGIPGYTMGLTQPGLTGTLGMARSTHPWLLAALPREYDEQELLHIEKWLKTRDPSGVLT